MYKDSQIESLYTSLLSETYIEFEFRWDKKWYRKPIRCFEWRLAGSNLPWNIAQLPFWFDRDEVKTLVKLFK